MADFTLIWPALSSTESRKFVTLEEIELAKEQGFVRSHFNQFFCGPNTFYLLHIVCNLNLIFFFFLFFFRLYLYRIYTVCICVCVVYNGL